MSDKVSPASTGSSDLMAMSQQMQAQQKQATMEQMMLSHQSTLNKKEGESATSTAKTYESVNGS